MQGFGYDPSGNLTGDPNTGPNNIAYDAENRQTSYTKSGTTAYGYDGDGHRVTKTAGGATTVFVYNIAGQLVAEYGGAATIGGTSYLTTDHLGSTRAVTNGSKDVVARHDYLPFGEELFAGTGNRTPGLGYSTRDDTTQRFTSKESDSESGLDYFGTRYYSASQGRFTSADTLIGSSRILSGQSWNHYCYGLNSPLRYVDPLGMDPPDDPQHLGPTTGGVPIADACHIGNCPSGAQPPQLDVVTVTAGATATVQTVDLPAEISTLTTAFEGTAAAAEIPGLAVGGGIAGLILAYIVATPGGMLEDMQTAGMIQALSGLDTTYNDQAMGKVQGAILQAAGVGSGSEGGLPDNTIVVRGGIGAFPPPGETFSGAQGATLYDAASGVPHNQITYTTAGEIRQTGGTVTSVPEPAYQGGPINERHVNITLGSSNPFAGPIPNPVPKDERVKGRP